jgi:hypothetical protein
VSTTVAIPHAAGAAAPAATEGRRLEVPVGGTSWVWALWGRWAFLFSLTGLAWLTPQFLGGFRLYSYLDWGVPWFISHYPLHSSPEVSLRIYQHVVPLVIAALWLLLDRKRKHEAFIHEAGQTLARYTIAFILSSYSLEKTFGGQGSGVYTAYSTLLGGYGVVTRSYGLKVWLGHSIIYENFAAFVEMVPLMLAPFRRTAPYSALIALAACVNVWVVNTGHWNLALGLTPIAMIMLPVFVLAPHAKRYWQLFTGQPAEPTVYLSVTPPKIYWWARIPGKVWVVFYGLSMHTHFFAAAPDYYTSELGGLYRVETFTRNGKVEPLAAEYPHRWREVVLGRQADEFAILTVDDEKIEYRFDNYSAFDPNDRRSEHAIEKWTKMTAAPEGDLPYGGGVRTGLEYGTEIVGDRYKRPWPTEWQQKGLMLHYARRSPDEVTISTVIKGDTIQAQLRRVDFEAMPLYRHRLYPEPWRGRFAIWMRDHGIGLM